MKVLTDTHTLVWALSSDPALSAKARRAMADGMVIASVANLWELILKRGKKDALVSDPVAWWEKHVARTGIEILAIRQSHVAMLGNLPDIHKDPFDRILVAQAIVEKASLVTKDRSLAAYRIPLIW